MAVLAAGSSRRFGKADKLTMPFHGKRLGEHVTDNAPLDLIAPGCARVIASRSGHPCEAAWSKAGFTVAINSDAVKGMGTSVALAARLSIKAQCNALLIALADMPLVPRKHFAALISKSLTKGATLCSSDGKARMPPVIFGQDFLPTLVSLNADEGARALLHDAEALACPVEWLIDVDTPEALARFG